MPSGIGEPGGDRPESWPVVRESAPDRRLGGDPGVQNGWPGWLIFGVTRTGVVADLM